MRPLWLKIQQEGAVVPYEMELGSGEEPYRALPSVLVMPRQLCADGNRKPFNNLSSTVT